MGPQHNDSLECAGIQGQTSSGAARAQPPVFQEHNACSAERGSLAGEADNVRVMLGMHLPADEESLCYVFRGAGCQGLWDVQMLPSCALCRDQQA